MKPTRVTNTIRAQRFAHDEMTQAELARRIGVSRQTVIAIEQGRYSPSLEMAFQIAQAFGVPLDSVFQYAAGTGAGTGTGGANGTSTSGGTDDNGGDS
ncbi:helix-turn-helix transcriptional regulator [Streptomyces sp. WM6372]|uniref:helix-turn-helix transcriptional regulator n=1 Tax=Streptomyces sp. WM6372 TaxID=1415555 RepID=UPI000A448A09